MATLGRQIVYLVSNFSKVKPRTKRLYLFYLRFYFSHTWEREGKKERGRERYSLNSYTTKYRTPRILDYTRVHNDTYCTDSLFVASSIAVLGNSRGAHKRLIRIRVSPLTCANNTENMIRDTARPRPDRIWFEQLLLLRLRSKPLGSMLELLQV